MFTLNEYCDMYFVLGECGGNFRRAAVTYAERYHERRPPDKNVFQRLDQRMRETGRVDVIHETVGRPRTARTPQVEEAVLQAVEDNPNVSIRGIVRNLNVNYSVVQPVLKSEAYHPFHYTKVQALSEDDFPLRVNFCRWMLDAINLNPNFQNQIMWTDESTFTRDGIFNMHNHHYWAIENPHVIRRRAFQQRFSVNVWAGIMGDQLVGPYFLPNRLNGHNFLNFLRGDFQELQDNLPLVVLLNPIWLQLDGAPAHFARPVRQWLNNNYPRRWIGRRGFIAWPPRSCDITPLDFFLWGHIKTIVYRTAPNSEQELRQRILNAAQTITPQMLRNVQGSIRRKLGKCIEANGQNFEHLLSMFNICRSRLF
jgi:hypothetical protein